MHLKNLRLQHFRNHADSTFEFSSKTNIFLGDNGHGKTNVIEAIAYLCLTKSFYANSDNLVLGFGYDLFEIDGTIVSINDQTFNIRVAYSVKQTEKIFSINKHRIEPLSSVIGKFPVVICSPEHAPITSKGPAERRKFVDFVISQSNHVYFQNLIEYRRVLRHRNKILLDAKILKCEVKTLIEPWNEQLIERGSYLMFARMQFVEEFKEFIMSAYHEVVSNDETPSLEYSPGKEIGNISNENEIRDILYSELKEKSSDEIKIGTSLVGPQRDEFKLKINGLDVRKYASQGQHKTFLIALKIGEFFYLKERCSETPILLLDDIFSELDNHRAGRLLRFVDTLSQTLITSTNPYLFDENASTSNSGKTFYIRSGEIVEQRTIEA